LEFRALLTRNAESRIWQQAGSFLLSFEQYQLALEFLLRAKAEVPAANQDLAIALFFPMCSSLNWSAAMALRRAFGAWFTSECLPACHSRQGADRDRRFGIRRE